MPRGPEMPSIRQLQQIAADFHLDLSEADLAQQWDAMTGVLRCMRELGMRGSEPALEERVMAGLKRLEARGAMLEEVSIPMHVMGLRIWYGICSRSRTFCFLANICTGPIMGATTRRRRTCGPACAAPVAMHWSATTCTPCPHAPPHSRPGCELR